jgi:hypothetical protein
MQAAPFMILTAILYGIPSIDREIGGKRQVIDHHGALIHKLHDYVIPGGIDISVTMIVRTHKSSNLG